jgi:hypothetical protein
MIGDALHIEVEGSRITITMPGTDYYVTYEQQSATPHLALTQSRPLIHTTTPAISDFRVRAFQAAVTKARELGWIV